jgi:hypothetical protein
MTEFSELRRKLLKAGMGQYSQFCNPADRLQMNNLKRAAQHTPLLKAGQWQSRWF